MLVFRIVSVSHEFSRKPKMEIKIHELRFQGNLIWHSHAFISKGNGGYSEEKKEINRVRLNRLFFLLVEFIGCNRRGVKSIESGIFLSDSQQPVSKSCVYG